MGRPRKNGNTASDICRLAYAAIDNLEIALARLERTNADIRARQEIGLVCGDLETIHSKARLIVNRERDLERKSRQGGTQ